MSSDATGIFKNQILNSLICLNSGKILTGLHTAGYQHINSVLMSIPQTSRAWSFSPTSTCSQIIWGQDSAKLFFPLYFHTSTGYLAKCLTPPAQSMSINQSPGVNPASVPKPYSGGEHQTHTYPGDSAQPQLGEILKCSEGPTHLFKAILFSRAFLISGIKPNVSAALSSCLSSPNFLAKEPEPGEHLWNGISAWELLLWAITWFVVGSLS